MIWLNLSNNVVSQFVKITNDYRKKEDQTKAYGTVVIYDDQQYVQLDGSDLLTPVDSTVHVKDNDRVTVTIKDHNAIIDGNTSDISASNQQLLEVSNELVNFKVDVDGLLLEVRNETDTKFAQFKVDVDGLLLEVRDETDTKISQLEVSTNAVIATIRDDVNSKYTSLKATTDGLQTTVSKKIGSADVKTIVTQNADSWKLSINGKLSGTNYKFDGTNFTIGSSSGSTTAYHASSYSKWTHSDGSYTRIDAKGMTWSKGGSTSGYHYLMYAGEYTCDSESTVTVKLPDEFIGKNFKVVTSIKRIYISNDTYVTGCYFPLLSFYAEALNVNKNTGTFQVYASIRAWNRTGYSNWGAMIGNGTTAAEKAAIKPVVAYWAFV